MTLPAWIRAVAPVLIAGLCGSALPGLGCDDSTVDSPFEPGPSGDDAGPTDPGGGADAGTQDAGPPLGKPCLDDEQCNDDIECTFDECVEGPNRCRSVPDHSKCADDVYCNGVEQCDLLLGCRPGIPIACSDGTPCTLDRCVEADQGCRHDPRDVDQDGDVDRLCEGEGDCNDTDPSISSLHPEICANGQDDDCDEAIDEAACQVPQYDTCDDPLVISAPGSFEVSTTATNLDYSADCAQAGAEHDVVLAIEVAEDHEGDIDIVASSEGLDLWMAEFVSCDSAATQVACVQSGKSLDGEPVARLRLHDPEPGVHSVVLFSENPGTIALSVSDEPAMPQQMNEVCNSAIALDGEQTLVARVGDARRDVPSVCGMVHGDLVYSFTLDEPQDVRLVAQSLDGYGTPQLSLQGAGCLQARASEITCRRGDGALLFVRNLAPATYFVAVAATGPSDVQVSLELEAPSQAPADETCDDPPALPLDQPLTLDLTAHTDDVFRGCLPGGIDAVYTLEIEEPSDVLLIERLAPEQQGAINLFDFPCQAEADRIACTTSNLSPVRVAAHNLAAGNYAVAVEASMPTQTTVTALHRPASPPSVVAFADTCDSAIEIPAQGGFFQGNTANANADYEAGCDLQAQGEGGAADQMLKLVLSEEKRVVFDMMGSSYDTLLTVRKGPSCPGEQVANGCSAGVNMARSYLDLTLPSGEYFVQVDGFTREEGAWFLDVYVVDP
jgi:hypothetical protein